MRFDNASKVEECVWNMRLADLPRDENRTIINQLFNGDPPLDEALAEENNVEINRNDLEGPILMSNARRQWNQAMLGAENFFTVTLDSGPPAKRREWGHIITREINRRLKKTRRQLEEKRATGGTTLLHGRGASTWNTRRSVIPVPLGMPSVLIPSETDLDFENLAYFSIFREWTPSQLYTMTHGPKVDPGWDMELVMSQLRYVAEQVTKQPNATAFQYMPERIEELIKQDMGFWGSDAVPTVDVWDFFFREAEEDGKGWYRRTILDWGVTDSVARTFKSKPDHSNKDADGKFLYTSKNRKYANSINEIIQCQWADCSAVFPQKVHSVRSYGWLLWGVCDLQNRLHCKFNEAVFQQLMWFFRVPSNEQFTRLKMANFAHMGVIPPGIEWVKAQDRYAPPLPLVEYAFTRNRGLMNESSTAYSQDFTRQNQGKEMTATETMAIVNASNALIGGFLTQAYDYEDFKHQEQCRRILIKNNPDTIAKESIRAILKKGVPEQMLDIDRWIVQTERVIGAGNKQLAMGQVQFLQGVRKNLGPSQQRKIDHISIETALDDPALAEELAPVDGQKTASNSMHDAQLSTERLMRGLPLAPRDEMVYEDYVKVWIADLELMVNQTEQTGGMASPSDIRGWNTMIEQTKSFLKIMAGNDEDKQKVKAYADRLKVVGNLVKAFEQRFMQMAEKQQKQNGQAAPDPKIAAQVQGKMALDAVKARNMETSHAQRTAQKQVQFEQKLQQDERRTNAEIRLENAKAAHELVRGNLKAFNEPTE